MSTIAGSVRVTGYVAPSDSTDVYAAHDEEYGAGGYRSVIDLLSRDAITLPRRKEGMLVYVKSTGITYQLDGGIDNINWIEYKPNNTSTAEYPVQTNNIGKYLQTDGTNVLWADIPYPVDGTSLNYGTYQLQLTSAPGAVGTNMDWLSITRADNTIDGSQLANTKQLVLKAGRTYKIDGGVETITATSGILSCIFTTRLVSNNEVDQYYSTLYDTILTGGSVRRSRADMYISPTVDVYLELVVSNNTLVGCTSFITEFTVSEFFLIGLRELPDYKLNTEVLTGERWIDGKPIYRMAIDFGSLPNSNTKSVAIPGYNANYTYWLNLGKSYSKNPNTDNTIPLIIDGINKCDIIAGNLNVLTNIDFSTYTNTIILVEYVKNTDTVDTPVALVGGKVDLPTDPEIKLGIETYAGYKRNGKNVYQVEVDFGALPNNTTKSVAIPGYNAAHKYWIDTSNSYILAPASNDTYQPMIAGLASLTHSVSIYVRAGNVLATTGMDRSTQSAIVVLKYTK
jgi:hypothetical protein